MALSPRQARSHDLNRHRRTHLVVKPYACSCGASFTRKDAIKRHWEVKKCPEDEGAIERGRQVLAEIVKDEKERRMTSANYKPPDNGKLTMKAVRRKSSVSILRMVAKFRLSACLRSCSWYLFLQSKKLALGRSLALTSTSLLAPDPPPLSSFAQSTSGSGSSMDIDSPNITPTSSTFPSAPWAISSTSSPLFSPYTSQFARYDSPERSSPLSTSPLPFTRPLPTFATQSSLKPQTISIEGYSYGTYDLEPVASPPHLSCKSGAIVDHNRETDAYWENEADNIAYEQTAMSETTWNGSTPLVFSDDFVIGSKLGAMDVDGESGTKNAPHDVVYNRTNRPSFAKTDIAFRRTAEIVTWDQLRKF